jgi:5-methylcytosine-specific restriction enzyme A
MADFIPEGITRSDVVTAIRYITLGRPHNFADSTDYDLIFKSRRYPPKAVLGLAARRLAGRAMRPSDFKGGQGSKCFRILNALGFTIARKRIESTFPDEVLPGKKFNEGACQQVWVNRFERNPKLRRNCLSYYKPVCCSCGMNFKDKYGELGADFIHVHHLKPLASVHFTHEVDPITDLRPVCPNCHCMLHRTDPPLTIEALKDRIAKVKDAFGKKVCSDNA